MARQDAAHRQHGRVIFRRHAPSLLIRGSKKSAFAKAPARRSRLRESGERDADRSRRNALSHTARKDAVDPRPVIAETPAPHREVFHSPGRIADGVRDDAFEHIAFRFVLPCGCHPAGFKDDGINARAVTGIGSTRAHTPDPHSADAEPSRVEVRAFARRVEDHHPSTLNHIARASFEQGCRLLSKRSDGGMIRLVAGVWDRFF